MLSKGSKCLSPGRVLLSAFWLRRSRRLLFDRLKGTFGSPLKQRINGAQGPGSLVCEMLVVKTCSSRSL